MSYKCEICQTPVSHRQPQLRFTVFRGDPRQIAREIAVCRPCREDLVAGADPARLAANYQAPPAAADEEAAPPVLPIAPEFARPVTLGRASARK